MTKNQRPVPKSAPKEAATGLSPAGSVHTESTLAVWSAKGRPVPDDKVLTLSKEALLLNDNAYEVVRNGDNPLRKGLKILGFIVLVVVVARLVALGLGYLTTPRWDLLQSDLLGRLTSTRWYELIAGRNPDFAPAFQGAYVAFWQLFRLFGGYPSVPGTLAGVGGFVLSTFGGWLTFGLLGHAFARWFGGQATLRQFLGALALSFAPLLLYALQIVPGFRMPWVAMTLMVLVTRFIAVRRTYRLSTGYSLMTIILPYLVLGFVGLAAAALGAAYGLNQIPFINEIIVAIQIWAGR